MWQIKISRTILFAVYLIYMAQGQLYPIGHPISKVALVILLGISLFYFIKLNFLKLKKNSFYYWWTFFLILNIVGFVFTGDYYNSNQIGMIRSILICFLPFYPFYYFAYKDELKKKHLLTFFLLLLPIIIWSFYANASEILLERANGSEDVVNNVGYTFVFFIPYVILMSNKRVASIVVMLILLYFIVESSKRGAILAGVGGLIIFSYNLITTVDKKNKWKEYLFAAVGITLITYYIYDFYMQNEYLQYRFNEMLAGNSSGRDVIFSKIYNSWFQSTSYLNLIFGFGFAASLKISNGHFAHNDILEVLSNFGLIGVVSYLILLITLIKMVFLKELDKENRILLLSIIVVWILSAVTARWYISITGFTQAAILAYVIGNRTNQLN